MKKILFCFSIVSICLFFFLACENLFISNTENTTGPVKSVTIELPEFYICNSQNSTTTIEEGKIADYFNKPAYIPEDKIPEEYIDIRPMVYGEEWKEETVDAVTLTENEGATCIALTSSQSNLWDIFLASKNIWNFEANTNYKVSFEAKASNEDDILLVELKDTRKTDRGGNICTTLTTEFKSYSFETGSYNKAWKGNLQVALGYVTSEIYIKNLKIEKIEGKSLPFGIYLASKDDKITTEKVDNGVKFSFESVAPDTKPNSSWPCINTGIAIEDNKLYEVTFNASANEKDVTLNVGAYPINSNYSHSWKVATIGTKPILVKIYVPGAVKNDEKYRFLDIDFNTPKNNSITITDVKVVEVTKMPQDVDLFVKINDKYGEITNEIPYTIAKIPAGESFSFDMCFSTINSREINWNDFCKICEFSNTNSFPESLDILNSLNQNGQVERTFTNNTTEEKYYKISLNSNWEIVIEETDFSIIDVTNQDEPSNEGDENISNFPDESDPNLPDNSEDNESPSDNEEINIENINILVENKDGIQWSVGEWIFNYEHITNTKSESSQTGTREGIISIEGLESDSKVTLTTLDKTTEIFENEDTYLAKKTEIQEKTLDEGIKVTFDDENLTFSIEYPETQTEITYTEFTNEFISYFDFGKSFYTNTEQNSYLIWYSQENENISESEMHLFVKK